MATVAVNPSTLPYLLLALMGGNPSNFNNDNKVQVNVKTDNFDGSVDVPTWALSQAAATLGYIPTKNWSYDDDDSLPSSIKMDGDWYEIRIDLAGAAAVDQDKVKVKIMDSQNIKVEAKEKSINRYGATVTKTVTRRYPVPRTYDVYKLNARTSSDGLLTISIPNKNNNGVTILRNSGSVTVDY